MGFSLCEHAVALSLVAELHVVENKLERARPTGTLAQPQSKSGSSDYPSPSSSSNRQSTSSSTSDSLSRTADTPPERFLDAFRYVYSTCGERMPRPRASPGANGHTNGRCKARTDVVVDMSMFDRSRTRRVPAPAA
ncbi:hypothetical protein DFH11DRAFT_1729900 [Phellopilus nigrolimitatus]|nr:hypothetical protein DFH11DRAFT_1729900 [Phellopilus nigrolimitatus]